MKIQGINIIPDQQWWQNRSFKCHKGTTERIRDYGKVIQDTGFFKGNQLDIYSVYDKEGSLMYKLCYLSDSVGNWLKSKLEYYENGKVVKEIRSEKK